MKTSQTEKRIYYSDTDAGKVVYYAKYLEFFEIGRTEILRQSGIDYADVEKQGIIAPVVNVNCDYKCPIKYNEIIIIETAIEKIGNSSIKFNYKILRKEDKKLLAEGSTVNVFVDKKEMKSVKIPEDIITKLNS